MDTHRILMGMGYILGALVVLSIVLSIVVPFFQPTPVQTTVVRQGGRRGGWWGGGGWRPSWNYPWDRRQPPPRTGGPSFPGGNTRSDCRTNGFRCSGSQVCDRQTGQCRNPDVTTQGGGGGGDFNSLPM